MIWSSGPRKGLPLIVCWVHEESPDPCPTCTREAVTACGEIVRDWKTSHGQNRPLRSLDWGNLPGPPAEPEQETLPL